MSEDRQVRPWDFFKEDTMYASDKIAEERMSICNNCEFFFKFTKQCKVCMCVMPWKATLADATCPKGKWGKTTDYKKEI